ncbi:MAG: CRISPR-associated protein Csx20 [Thermonemataceae bacterium]|nr:CRISPR-associated protein Csx20 [Thermonemataceae bacterium]
MNLYLLFSHSLTPEQIQDAQENWQIKNFIALPEELQSTWSNVPPLLSSLKTYLKDIFLWLEQAQKADKVLIQGDFGATYLMIQFARQRKLVPIYSTTTRKVIETVLPDGSIHTERLFVHQQFRIYEKI